jgi:predicted TIM-barrel fold metal-dependent hydrolase
MKVGNLFQNSKCDKVDETMNRNETPITRRHFLATTAAAVSMGSTAPAGAQRLPLIDCHLHINHMQRSLADTIQHMDATATNQAFILPLETGEGGVLLKPETVLEAFRQYPKRIIPFCQCDVRQPGVVQRIRDFQRLGCRGVGEQKEHLPLNDRRIEAVIALCDELDWPITLHFQDGPKGFNQGLSEHLEPYLKRYKRVRILAHAQTWWANISAEVPPPEKTLYPKGPVKPGGLVDRLLSDYPNLYADLSAGSGYNALSRDEDFTAGFLERHRKQLVFGSDCPCTDGKGGNFRDGCYSTRLQRFLRRLVRDEQALRDLFHDNALRALNGQAK